MFWIEMVFCVIMEEVEERVIVFVVREVFVICMVEVFIGNYCEVFVGFFVSFGDFNFLYFKGVGFGGFLYCSKFSSLLFLFLLLFFDDEGYVVYDGIIIGFEFNVNGIVVLCCCKKKSLLRRVLY